MVKRMIISLSMLETKSSVPPLGKVEHRWNSGWRVPPLISIGLQPCVNGGSEGERFQPLLRARGKPLKRLKPRNDPLHPAEAGC